MIEWSIPNNLEECFSNKWSYLFSLKDLLQMLFRVVIFNRALQIFWNPIYCRALPWAVVNLSHSNQLRLEDAVLTRGRISSKRQRRRSANWSSEFYLCCLTWVIISVCQSNIADVCCTFLHHFSHDRRSCYRLVDAFEMTKMWKNKTRLNEIFLRGGCLSSLHNASKFDQTWESYFIQTADCMLRGKMRWWSRKNKQEVGRCCCCPEWDCSLRCDSSVEKVAQWRRLTERKSFAELLFSWVRQQWRIW